MEEPLLSVLSLAALGPDSEASLVCSCLHEQFVAAGFSDGSVIIFDFGGRPRRRWKAHRDRVVSIFVDSTGLFVGTIGGDGSIISWSVNSEDHFLQPSLHAPRTATFSPDYARAQSRRLCAGNAAGNVFLISATPSFGGSPVEQAHLSVAGEGPIRSVQWCGPLVAFATSARVYVKDVEQNGGCFPSLPLIAFKVSWNLHTASPSFMLQRPSFATTLLRDQTLQRPPLMSRPAACAGRASQA